MPKITVTEKDLSWYVRQRATGPVTVYMPGLATFGPDTPVLCDSSNFMTTFGKSSVNLPGEVSGFNVLFHRVVLDDAAKASVTSDTITINAKYPGTYGNELSISLKEIKGGESKRAMLVVYANGGTQMLETHVVDFTDAMSDSYYANIESDFIEFGEVGEVSSITPLENQPMSGGKDFADKSTLDNVLKAVEAKLEEKGHFTDLEDPYQFDFDVVTSAMLSVPEETGTIGKVDQALFNLVTKRGTAIYLVDGKSDWDYTEAYTYAGLFNSSYAAMFGPWGYAQLLDSGRTMLLPGSYAMLVRWAQSCSEGTPKWMAPAGVKRASLGSFYKDTKYVVGKTVLDAWQNHDYVGPDDYFVNPIMKAKQYGYVIYGNSTLLHSGLNNARSLLEQFSVRMIANTIKSHAFDISLYLQFDQMASDLYVQFKTLMTTFMDQLSYTGAIYDYEIVLGDNGTITRALLNERTIPVLIRISPNPAAENFDITLEISQAGIDFTDETDETEEG